MIKNRDYLILEFNKHPEAVSEEENSVYKRILSALKMAGKTVGVYIKYIPAPQNSKLGDEYTLEEIEEYYREDIEKAEEEKRKWEEEKRRKEEELEKKREEALSKAKETGREVLIRPVGEFNGDAPTREDWMFYEDIIKETYRRYGRRELGIVTIYEIATPEGKIVYRGIPSF